METLLNVWTGQCEYKGAITYVKNKNEQPCPHCIDCKVPNFAHTTLKKSPRTNCKFASLYQL